MTQMHNFSHDGSQHSALLVLTPILLWSNCQFVHLKKSVSVVHLPMAYQNTTSVSILEAIIKPRVLCMPQYFSFVVVAPNVLS